MNKYQMLCFLMILCTAQICLSADITYTYDDLNRLSRIEYGDGASAEYTYDDVHNRTRRDCRDTIIPGDTDGSRDVEIKDVILDLQITSGSTPRVYIQKESGVGDEVIGVEEAVYGLQAISGN